MSRKPEDVLEYRLRAAKRRRLSSSGDPTRVPRPRLAPDIHALWLDPSLADDLGDCTPFLTPMGDHSTYDVLYPASLAAVADRILKTMFKLVYGIPYDPRRNCFHVAADVKAAKEDGRGRPFCRVSEIIVIKMLVIHRLLLTSKPGDNVFKFGAVPAAHVCDGCCVNKGAMAQRLLELWPSRRYPLPILHSDTTLPCVAECMRAQINAQRSTRRSGLADKTSDFNPALPVSSELKEKLIPALVPEVAKLRTLFLVAIPGFYHTRKNRVVEAVKTGDGATLVEMFRQSINIRYLDEILQRGPEPGPDCVRGAFDLNEFDWMAAGWAATATAPDPARSLLVPTVDRVLAPGSFGWEEFYPTLVTLAVSWGRPCFVEMLTRMGAGIVYPDIPLDRQFPGCTTMTPAVLATCIAMCRVDILARLEEQSLRSRSLFFGPGPTFCAVHAELNVFARVFLVPPLPGAMCCGVLHQHSDSPVASILAYYSSVVIRNSQLQGARCIPAAKEVVLRAMERKSTSEVLQSLPADVFASFLDFQDVTPTFSEDEIRAVTGA